MVIIGTSISYYEWLLKCDNGILIRIARAQPYNLCVRQYETRLTLHRNRLTLGEPNWHTVFDHLQVAQIANGTGSATPYLNQITITGGGKIRGIVADQNSTVWVTNKDSTMHTISDLDGTINAVAGVSVITGLGNPYSFGSEYKSSQPLLWNKSDDDCHTLWSRLQCNIEFCLVPRRPNAVLNLNIDTCVYAAIGDASGYLTAPVSSSATYTYLHDTATRGKPPKLYLTRFKI